MAESVIFPKPSGATYTIPDVNDENWGQNVTNYLLAIPNGVPPTSGLFSLTGDLSFGPSFGLTSLYFRSVVSNPASSGAIRLANTDGIRWRNVANTNNDSLSIDASDNLLYNGNIVLTGASGGFVSSITGTANEIIASSSTGAITLSTPQGIGTTSTPTFGGLTVNTAGITLGGTNVGISNSGAFGISSGSSLTLTGTAISLNGPITANSHKITSLSNGTTTGDALAFGQAVTSITGTTNEIIVGGTATVPVLSTPQAIGTGSSVTFLSVTTSNNMTAGTNIGIQNGGALNLINAANTNTIGISAPSTTATYSNTLPPTQGSVGNFLSISAQPGSQNTLVWANPTGVGTVTSVSGTTNQIAVATGTSTPVISITSPVVFPGAATVTGNLTFSPTTAGITGTPTNNSAAAGVVGERISNFMSGVTLPDSIEIDVASVALTAGDWDVSAVLSAVAASGQNVVSIGISITPGNSTTGLTTGDTRLLMGAPTLPSTVGMSLPLVQMSLTGNTTVYLKGRSNSVTTGTAVGAGRITARRVR